MVDSGVLFVDDNRDILELATSFFACEGMEVHCAANGAEALRKLRDRTFLLMITDFDMPGINGLELAGKTREIARDMPIVMVTGDISPEIRRLAMEAGIVKVFAKPFHFGRILTMVKGRMEK